jgi:hypothetical protein
MEKAKAKAQSTWTRRGGGKNRSLVQSLARSPQGVDSESGFPFHRQESCLQFNSAVFLSMNEYDWHRVWTGLERRHLDHWGSVQGRVIVSYMLTRYQTLRC